MKELLSSSSGQAEALSIDDVAGIQLGPCALPGRTGYVVAAVDNGVVAATSPGKSRLPSGGFAGRLRDCGGLKNLPGLRL